MKTGPKNVPDIWWSPYLRCIKNVNSSHLVSMALIAYRLFFARGVNDVEEGFERTGVTWKVIRHHVFSDDCISCD